MFQLRDYQQETLDAIKYGHQEHASIAVELATGLGKTILFTKYAATFQEHYGQRSMVIAPQITLIGQAAKKIFKETGVMPAIEQATNYSNEEDWGKSPFVVASKQTLTSNDRYKRFTDIGLVVIDECHYAATKIYSELIDHFRDNGAMVLGVSATLKRHDKRAIGQIFSDCVYQYGICDAITDGWLVPVKVTCKQLEKLDLSGVQTVNSFFGKDFNLQQLNEKLENPEVIYEICEAVAAETTGQKTAIFCSSITEAQAVAELLQDKYRIAADWICADTRKCSPSKREETMNSFHHPDGITHLANVGILTTGWDYPALMNLVMARPTKSLPLYTQIFGRLTRPWEEDGHTAVDFEGSTPDLRRQAIAASKKPFGRMIDLVDVSLKHKIVTGGDVLGGKWTLDDDQLTCRFCLQSFPSMVAMTVHLWQAHEEEMLKAQQKSQEEHEQETDELNIRLRQQRAAVRAKALFHDVDVNPFEGGRRARAREVKQREMATTKQKRYMWVLGFKDIDNYSVTKHQAMRMIGQLKNGAGLEEVKRQNRLVRK